VPVEVRIPLTLRLDPTLVGGGIGSEVADAVDAAVGRALKEMDREVIAPRGGYAWPRFHAPEFEWGAGLAAADRDWRTAIETDLTRAVAQAVARAPDSSAERLADAPEVMPNDPFERFDPRRMRGGHYLVPSYDGDVPAPDEPVTLDRMARNRGWLQSHSIRFWSWHGSDSGLLAQLRQYLNDMPSGSVQSGALGLLYFGAGSSGNDVMRVAVLSIGSAAAGAVGADLLRTFPLGGFQQFDADSDSPRPVRENLFSEAHIVKGRAIEGLADARAAALAHFMAKLRLSPQPVEGESQEQSQLRQFVDRVAGQLDFVHPDGFFAEFVLPSGSSYVCSVPRVAFSGTSLRVLPIFSLFKRPAERGGEGSGRGDGEGAGRGRGEGAGQGQGGGAGQGQDEGAGQGQGGGAGQGQGGGAGQGEGDGAGRRGSPLAEPGAEGGEGATRFYPVGRGGEVVEIDLGPFNGEPSLDDLGELADPLRRLMRQIAFRLEMPMGNYAGSFCIAAAQMIGVRASGVAGMAETTPRITRAVEPGTGNLGDVDMGPSHSPAVTVIRYIAGTCPLLTRLQHLMVEFYNIPRIAAMISGWREGHPIEWALDFYKSYTPKLKDSVGYLFIRTCQIKMLVLLRNSKSEIEARLNNFDTYYPMVRSMILGMVEGEAELEELRRRLSEEKARRGDFSARVAETYRDWREARHALTTSLSGQILNLSALTSSGSGPQGTIVDTPQGPRIRDRHGRTWSDEELEQAIAFRHGTAASIDPLIHQFRDIPEVVQTFRQSPQLSRWYLRSLLQEMQRNNAEITSEAISNDMFAFRAGKIRADLPNRTIPYTDLALQGIHLMTHQAIGDAFEGDHSYGLGVQHVMSIELGRQGLMVFAETVSVIALAVVCPPAAAALGAIYAGIHYADAAEIEQLYGSLIDPELILSRAEVEFDLFMAEFELALSIIPEAGSVVRGGVTATRTVARSGIRAGTRSLARRARRELMVSIGRQAKTGIARHIVREVLTDRGLALVLPQLLGPLMMQVHREISVLSGRPVPPQAAGTPALPEHLSENENQLIRRLEEYQEGSRDESLPGAEEAP
jgi:hypothetical protein